MLHAQRCTHMLQALRWMLQRLPPRLCVQHWPSRSRGGFSPTLPVTVERWRSKCRERHFSSSSVASTLPPANQRYPAPQWWWSVGARPAQCGALVLHITRGIVAGERPLQRLRLWSAGAAYPEGDPRRALPPDWLWSDGTADLEGGPRLAPTARSGC